MGVSSRDRGGGSSRPFRFRPPRAGASAPIPRPRLLEVLAGRFDRRLTILEAPSGFGKTTLLAQAVEDNLVEPSGSDVWLGCASTDESAEEFASGLLTALDHDDDGGDSARAVIDAVWARAPERVALVLDDAHLVGDRSPAAGLLAALIDDLPANGHVVLGTRTAPAIPLARLRATGQVVVIGESDLAFDADELAAFAEARNVDLAVVDRSGGWPALAELESRSERATDDLVAVDLLPDLGAERHEALVRLAVLEDFDDDMVRVVTGLDLGAAALVEGLPLTSVDADGVRLHDLWRGILTWPGLDGPDEGIRAGAELLQARGRHRDAFDALDRAGDVEAVDRFVAAFARTDFPEIPAEDVRHVLKRVPREVADGGYGALLRAAVLLGEDGAAALEALVEATDALAAAGDHEGEAVAWVRRLMMHFWQADLAAMGPVLARLGELAELGVARAARSLELSAAYGLLASGQPEAAMARVAASGARRDPAAAALAGFLVVVASLDLGQPERALQEIAVTLPSATGRTKAGLLGAQLEARCLQGVPDEVEYRSLADELDRVVRSLGVVENIVLNDAGSALMELRYGRTERARRLVEDARRELPATVGARARIAVAVAEAALLVEEGDELSAAGKLTDLVDGIALAPRPDRALLRVLPLVYALVPSTREQLDGSPLGPTWDVARRTGRSLVALRESDDLTAAAALDWDHPRVVRALASPIHVAELAVAAVATGSEPARDVLLGLPTDVRRCLKALVDRGGELGVTAQRLLGEVPSPPDDVVEIRVLGPLEVWRGGKRVDEPGWRRERVRSLLALLVDRRVVTREALATELWPDLDRRAGLNNLRVNLNHLQQVLQPGRDRDEPPWFVRAVDDSFQLVAGERLTIDADEFDREVDAARQADERGVPAQALEHNLAALVWYRGEYLADAPDSAWGAFERLRFRGRFVAAAVRAGELLLVAGDHHGALRLATQAGEVEPVSEAAHRLRARALRATGDPEGAARILRQAVELVRSHGLEPEPATLRARDEGAATG